MEKNLKIKNHSTLKDFIEKQLKNSSIRNLETQIGLSHGILNKLLNKSNYNMRSDNLWKIVNYFKCPPNDIGIEELETTLFSIRLRELIEEKNLKHKDIVNVFETTETTFSKWIYGETEPTITQVKKGAKYFNVHYLYLLGEINTRNVYDSTVNDILGLKDETINYIKYCYNNKIYGTKQHKAILENFGFDYIDIVDFVASDIQFFDVFYLEAIRVMEYYSSPNFNYDFNNLFNTLELEPTESDITLATSEYPTPYNVSVETFTKAILCEKVKKMFDIFIDKKMKEKGINRNYK